MKKLILLLVFACCSVAHAQFTVTRTSAGVVQQPNLIFVTPNIGVATATTVNGLSITSSTGTLTIPNGVVLTGPASSGTAMTLGNAETVTGVKTFDTSVLKMKESGGGSDVITFAAPSIAGNITVTWPDTTGTLLYSGGPLGTPSGGAANNMTTATASAGDADTSIASTGFVDAASKVVWNAQTGTTYTLLITDGYPGTNAVSISNVSAQTLTVPTNASVAFPTGTTIAIQRLGAGVTTVAPAGGVTFSPTGSFTINAQYATVWIIKTATDTWKIIGTAGISSADVVGTTTNDNATAGNLGEYVSSYVASGSAISLTTNTAANITSISLTAGDWDVSANANFAGATATITATQAGISSTTATLPTDGSEVYSGVTVTLVSETDGVTLPRKRFSVASTTTVYLVGKVTFSAGTVTAFGGLTARRVR